MLVLLKYFTKEKKISQVKIRNFLGGGINSVLELSRAKLYKEEEDKLLFTGSKTGPIM